MLRRLSGLLLSSSRTASTSVSSTSGGGGTTAPKEYNVGDDEGKNESEKMQRKTFRRWVNKYLKPRDMQVNHIINDWENGILLINLLEVLSRSEQPFAKYNKTPKMKLHSLENLNACLAFMKANQIPLVNIGSEDIYQHNPTIVMGLIWSLILKYGLAAGKIEVMNWCNKRLAPYGLEVKNFTEDWKNGYLFAAIVASQFPQQLDFSTCDRGDPNGNMEKAFTVADQYLEVNRLLDPQDVMTNPDEKSIVAYVGEIYSAIEDPRPPRPVPKPSEPTVSKISTSSLTLSWNPVHGAINMKVQVADSDEWHDVITLPLTETSHKVEGLLPDKPYQFRMVGLSSRTQSLPSEPLSCRTLAQGAPIVSDISVRSFKVSWDPHPKATEYQLQVLKKSDGSWDNAKIISAGSSTTASVDGLASASEYECRVIALVGSTPSEPSISCSVETLIEPPAKPALSNATDNSFRADWAPCEHATRYYVQVKGGEEDSWDTDPKTIEVDGSNTFCEIHHLVPGEAYHVRIIAEVEGKGISAPSDEETITTTMVQDRCALVTGADIGSGCGIIMRLLEQSSSSNTSWEQGFSTVYVVTENPSGALRKIAEKNPTKVKIILVRNFSDPEAIKEAARELGKMTNCINLCINYANLNSSIISGLLAGVGQ